MDAYLTPQQCAPLVAAEDAGLGSSPSLCRKDDTLLVSPERTDKGAGVRIFACGPPHRVPGSFPPVEIKNHYVAQNTVNLTFKCETKDLASQNGTAEAQSHTKTLEEKKRDSPASLQAAMRVACNPSGAHLFKKPFPRKLVLKGITSFGGSPPRNGHDDRVISGNESSVGVHASLAVIHSVVPLKSRPGSQKLFPAKKSGLRPTKVSSRGTGSKLSALDRSARPARSRVRTTRRNEAPDPSAVSNSRKDSLTRWYNELSRNLGDRRRVFPLPTQAFAGAATETECNSSLQKLRHKSQPHCDIRLSRPTLNLAANNSRLQVARAPMRSPLNVSELRFLRDTAEGSNTHPQSDGHARGSPSDINKQMPFPLARGSPEDEAVGQEKIGISEERIHCNGVTLEHVQMGTARKSGIPTQHPVDDTAKNIATRVGMGVQRGAATSSTPSLQPDATLMLRASRTVDRSFESSTRPGGCGDQPQAAILQLPPPETGTPGRRRDDCLCDSPPSSTRNCLPAPRQGRQRYSSELGNQPHVGEGLLAKPRCGSLSDTCKVRLCNTHCRSTVTALQTPRWSAQPFPLLCFNTKGDDIPRYRTGVNRCVQSAVAPPVGVAAPAEDRTRTKDSFAMSKVAGTHSTPALLHTKQNMGATLRSVAEASDARHSSLSHLDSGETSTNQCFSHELHERLLHARCMQEMLLAFQGQTSGHGNNAAGCVSNRIRGQLSHERQRYAGVLNGAGSLFAARGFDSRAHSLGPHTVQVITATGVTTAAAAVEGTAMVVGAPVTAAVFADGAAAVTTAFAASVVHSECSGGAPQSALRQGKRTRRFC